jgi:hypothetical protein
MIAFEVNWVNWSSSRATRTEIDVFATNARHSPSMRSSGSRFSLAVGRKVWAGGFVFGKSALERVMTGRTFVLVVVDRDSGEFTVEGPVSDDRPWNRAVVDAQKAGRNVRCFGMGEMMPNAAAAEWQAAHGGQRVAAGSIVAPTLDIS